MNLQKTTKHTKTANIYCQKNDHTTLYTITAYRYTKRF